MKLSHIILAVLVALVWGLNFVVIKLGLSGMSPMSLCLARFFLTSIPAIFLFKFPRASLGMIVLYGFVMFALQFLLLFLGMYIGITAGLASLLLQSQVFLLYYLQCFF